MYKTIKNILLISLSFGLVACAKPQTSTPTLDGASINAERAAQQRMINEQQGKAANIELLPQDQIIARMNRVAGPIQKAGTEICQQMYGANQACSYEIGLADQDVLNAWADGKGVYITPKMVSFAKNDEELANVLAHEYAHNILRHPQSTGQNAAAGAIGGMLLDVLANSQGYDTGGQFSKIGGNIGQYHYSVAFEKEADYVGQYVLARAGYNPAGADDFWRRFSIQDPNGLYGSRSHPSNPERTLAMQKTAQEIAAKKASGQPLLPNLKQR